MQTTVNNSNNGKQRQITAKTEVKRKNLYTIYEKVFVSLQRQSLLVELQAHLRVKHFEGLGRRVRVPHIWLRFHLPHSFWSMSKKDKVEMKRYTVEKPTDKAVSIVKALIDAMVESGVDPEEVLFGRIKLTLRFFLADLVLDDT